MFIYYEQYKYYFEINFFFTNKYNKLKKNFLNELDQIVSNDTIFVLRKINLNLISNVFLR